MPLSRTATSTPSGFSCGADVIESCRDRFSIVLMASIPFIIRFSSTCCSCTRSAVSAGKSMAKSVCSATLFRRLSLLTNATVSRMTSLISTRLFCGGDFFTNARISLINSLARFPCLIIRVIDVRASSRFGVSPASQRWAALPLVTIAESG